MQVYTPPIVTTWFQRELNRITRDRCPAMRIAWAPSLTVAKVIDRNGNEQKYAKYPLLFGEFHNYTRGVWFRREINGRWLTTGYQAASERLIPRGVRPTDLVIPDIVQVNPSAHIFVVERQIPDAKARKIHNDKRKLACEQLGFDLFGAFPKDGYWDHFMDISEHRAEQHGSARVMCCELARAGGASYCYGLYREPTRADLVEAERNVDLWLRTIAGGRESVAEQMTRDLIYETETNDKRRLIDLLKRAAEADVRQVQYEHSSRVPKMTDKQRGKHAITSGDS